MPASHLWTIVPRLLHRVGPTRSDRGEPWATGVEDPTWGEVRIGGRFHPRDRARSAVVLVHGLGGCSESHYMYPASEAARRRGFACLRLDLRGSDLEGEDLYHAALTDDIDAALSSPELEAYDRLYLAGFSLGGHMALRYATEDPHPRLRAVAAVCSPLELAPAQQEFDRPHRWIYRRYVLGRLRRLYRRVDARRDLDVPLSDVMAVRTIRKWDERTVVPRFGFRDADHYYREASVGPRLGSLRVPALLVAVAGDPMVPPRAIEPALQTAPDRIRVRWLTSGGHMGFPRNLDLGFPGPRGLYDQLLAGMVEAE